VESLILLILIIAYVLPSNWWLKKKFNIEEKSFNYVNKTHKLIELTISIMAIIGVIFSISRGVISIYLLIFSFIILMIVRAIMEWKYERGRKGYILSLNSLIVYILIAVAIIGFII